MDPIFDPDLWLTPVERRTILVSAIAALAALSGCAPVLRAATRATATAKAPPVPSAGPTQIAPSLPLGPIPPPHPGRPVLVSAGSASSNTLALTIDDGTSAEVVASYVDFALRTGFALTFFPNGRVKENWEPHALALRPLVERGQVQIGNHTWSHTDLLRMNDRAIRDDLERNEAWIEKTFGITSRPWLRPPFGNRNGHTDAVAAQLGFTHVVTWSGTFGDSAVKTPAEIVGAANQYGKPGAVILGHANFPPVTKLFDQILATFASKGLTGVTLDQMFGTSRSVG